VDNQRQTLLVIGAHPDPFDAVYQAGGLLAKYAKAGHRAIAVSSVYEDEWEEEVKAIADTIGAEHRFLDLVEGSVVDDVETIHKYMNLIREVRPDIVVAHQPTDYHPDHRAVSRAVLAACLLSRVAEIKGDHPPFVVRCLYYSDTTSGVNSEPNVYIDIGDVADLKWQALAKHERLSMKRGVPHLDSIEHLLERDKALAEMRGNEVEVEQAEAYRLAVNYRVMGAWKFLPVPDAPRAEE
jgi:LmbE family N-acetylglucosaminyl deacetylase